MEIIHLSKSQSNLTLTLHSGIAHMTHKLDAMATKTWFYLVASVFPHLENEENNSLFSLPSKGLLEFLGTRNYEQVKQCLESLRKTGITFNILNKDKNENWITTSLLSTVGMQDGNVIFEIPVFLRGKLLSYKEMFVFLHLNTLKKFKSKHSLGLYVVLADFLLKNTNQTSKILSLDELRTMLGIEKDQYQDYKIFNRAIIKKAVKEINSKSELVVDYEPHQKISRKIASLKFTFSHKLPEVISEEIEEQSFSDIDSSNLFIPKDEKVISFLNDYEVILSTKKNRKKIDELLNVLGEETLKQYLQHLASLTLKKKNELKSISGFFVSSLSSEDILESFLFKQQKEEEEKLKRKKMFDQIFNKKLKSAYHDDMSLLFFNQLKKQEETYQTTLESVFSKIKETADMFFQIALKNNDYKEDVNLLKNNFIRNTIYDKYINEFDFKPLMFEEWKEELISTNDGKSRFERIKFESEKELAN